MGGLQAKSAQFSSDIFFFFFFFYSFLKTQDADLDVEKVSWQVLY